MDTVDGLPLHPLIVHLVVVLVPLAALTVLVAALWPRARFWLGPTPMILALIGLVLTPITTSAGEDLQNTRGLFSPTIDDHTAAGDLVIIGTGCLFGAAALLYLAPFVLDRRPQERWLDPTAKVLAVAAAVAAVWLVYRAGDTGARAVWG